MNLIIQNAENAMRQIRKNFMIAAIKEGQIIREYIEQTDPELDAEIKKAFGNQTARAAFWMATDITSSVMTPLQQIARGLRNDLEERLKAYTKPKDRMPL